MQSQFDQNWRKITAKQIVRLDQLHNFDSGMQPVISHFEAAFDRPSRDIYVYKCEVYERWSLHNGKKQHVKNRVNPPESPNFQRASAIFDNLSDVEPDSDVDSVYSRATFSTAETKVSDWNPPKYSVAKELAQIEEMHQRITEKLEHTEAQLAAVAQQASLQKQQVQDISLLITSLSLRVDKVTQELHRGRKSTLWWVIIALVLFYPMLIDLE